MTARVYRPGLALVLALVFCGFAAEGRAAGFFEKMQKTRLLCGRIGMARNHNLVPLFDGFGRMLFSIFLQPSENCVVVIQLVGDFFERFSVDFEKRE